MTLVHDVMTTDVVTAAPDTALDELIRIMLVRGVSGVPVVDDERHVVGVVTEADLVARRGFDPAPRRLLSIVDDALHARHNRWCLKAAGLTASEIMTVPPETIHPSTDVRHAASRMVTLAIKRLPVVDDDGRLVGIIAQRDVLRLLRSDGDPRVAGEHGGAEGPHNPPASAYGAT
jgi:CBS domain-containing protein